MRKEKELILQDEGNTLTFILEKMSATQLDRWFQRFIFATGNNGGTIDIQSFLLKQVDEVKDIIGKDMPDVSKKDGAFIAIAIQQIVNIILKLPYREATALLEEMLNTAYYITPDSKRKVSTVDLDGYIENCSTLMKLRFEILKFNIGFFLQGMFSQLLQQDITTMG